MGSDKGMVMSTGNDNSAGTPKISTGTTGTTSGLSNDPDLKLIVGNANLDDLAQDTMKFIPTNDTVRVKYVFGSEEYPQFVNSTFNDVFAFFIRGPGIIGNPNIALIPTTVLPVTINNLNNGQVSCGTNPTGPCNN